tara:strand:- start:11 stop:193 length:183 start_codon:yes stop_codon:yes gene_type:complete
MFEKFMTATVLAILGLGFAWLLVQGLDGEMLVECHQMQQWAAEGHEIKVPDYCYELGLDR